MCVGCYIWHLRKIATNGSDGNAKKVYWSSCKIPLITYSSEWNFPVASNLKSKGSHLMFSRKKVMSPWKTPCQNHKDYWCLKHKQEVSGNKYIQTSVIYTILTQCYTRTLEEGELQTNLRQSFHSPVLLLPLLCGQSISSVMPHESCKETVRDPHTEVNCNTTKTVELISFVFPVHSAQSIFHNGSIKQETA